MLKFKSSRKLHRVVVLNPKGGSGKSTLAFNVAGYLASMGRHVAVVDMDAQGSSKEWLRCRGGRLPYIHSIAAPYEFGNDAEQIVEIPKDYDCIVVDAPAGVGARELSDFTCGAHAILIPIVPSAFDIHAASKLISDLLLVARVSRTKGRLGIVANRVKKRTLSYRRLQRFLESLSISVVGTLRDSQNYVQAATKGLCIHEMPRSSVRMDLAEWEAVANWLEDRLATPLTPRDWFRPEIEAAKEAEAEPEPEGRTAPIPIWTSAAAAAAVIAVVGISWGLWNMTGSETSSAPTQAAVAAAAERPRTIDRLAAAPMRQPNAVTTPRQTDVRDEFRGKWQLSGVAQAEGDSVVLVSQRDDKITRRIRAGTEIDGWVVKDTGQNYAVFAQDGKEVRLMLNEAAAE